MKYGSQIALFLQANSNRIVSMGISGDSTNGYLKIGLDNGSEKIFDKWDEEDQGYFACLLNGEQWDPSKRGIPKSLTLNTNSSSLNIAADKPLDYQINGKPMHQWGEKVSPTMWQKKEDVSKQQKPVSQQNEQGKGFAGLKKGFLG